MDEPKKSKRLIIWNGGNRFQPVAANINKPEVIFCCIGYRADADDANLRVTCLWRINIESFKQFHVR